DNGDLRSPEFLGEFVKPGSEAQIWYLSHNDVVPDLRKWSRPQLFGFAGQLFRWGTDNWNDELGTVIVLPGPKWKGEELLLWGRPAKNANELSQWLRAGNKANDSGLLRCPVGGWCTYVTPLEHRGGGKAGRGYMNDDASALAVVGPKPAD